MEKEKVQLKFRVSEEVNRRFKNFVISKHGKLDKFQSEEGEKALVRYLASPEWTSTHAQSQKEKFRINSATDNGVKGMKSTSTVNTNLNSAGNPKLKLKLKDPKRFLIPSAIKKKVNKSRQSPSELKEEIIHHLTSIGVESHKYVPSQILIGAIQAVKKVKDKRSVNGYLDYLELNGLMKIHEPDRNWELVGGGKNYSYEFV
jgi:hypothetical protein